MEWCLNEAMPSNQTHSGRYNEVILVQSKIEYSLQLVYEGKNSYVHHSASDLFIVPWVMSKKL